MSRLQKISNPASRLDPIETHITGEKQEIAEFLTSTVNSEIIATFSFWIKMRFKFLLYGEIHIINLNSSLNYCNYNPVTFFAVINTSPKFLNLQKIVVSVCHWNYKVNIISNRVVITVTGKILKQNSCLYLILEYLMHTKLP